MSNVAIAEHIGVSDVFVMKVRDELLTVRGSPGSNAETRTGRDGKKRKLPKKRKPAPKPEPVEELEDEPGQLVTATSSEPSADKP